MRQHRGSLQAENDAGGEPALTNYPRFHCKSVTGAIQETRQKEASESVLSAGASFITRCAKGGFAGERHGRRGLKG